jgi:hypothetical protein
MATEWNLDLLDFTPLDELLNLYPVNVVFTLSAGPVAMLKSDFTFDRPTTSTQVETTSNVFNTRINREGVFLMLALGLDNVQGGVSNGAAGLSFTYAYASHKGTILTNLDYDAKGEYDAGIGVAVGGTNFENLGIAVSLALTWAGDTEGEQTSFATSSPTTNAPAPAPAPTPGSSNPPNSCFSRDATVHVMRNKSEFEVVTMKDLKVGDKVRVGTNPDVYESVYAFGHLHQTKTVSFHQIYTEGSARPLELTGDHLVFVSGRSNPIRADSIKINDVLRTDNEKQGARVVKVSWVQKSGLYAPLTPCGRIMVDGILVSTYVSLQQHAMEFVEMKSGLFPSILSYHTYVHVGLSPFRIVCTKVSSSLCTRYDEDGVPYYAALAMRVNTWVHNQNGLVEVAAFMVLLFLLCVSIVLECLLTYPTFLWLVVPLFVITIRRRYSLKINKKA